MAKSLLQVFDNPELASWAQKVRKAHRAQKLAAWKVDKLEAAGFDWDVDKVAAKWHSNFHETRRYKVSQVI